MTTHLRLPDPADVESSRRRLVLGLALLTALVEIAVLAEVIPGIEIGDIAVSASLLPGLALAVACGSRLLGRSAGLRRDGTHRLHAPHPGVAHGEHRVRSVVVSGDLVEHRGNLFRLLAEIRGRHATQSIQRG